MYIIYLFILLYYCNWPSGQALAEADCLKIQLIGLSIDNQNTEAFFLRWNFSVHITLMCPSLEHNPLTAQIKLAPSSFHIL